MTVFYEVTTYLDGSPCAEVRTWLLVDARKPKFPVKERALYLRLELRNTKAGKAHKKVA